MSAAMAAYLVAAGAAPAAKKGAATADNAAAKTKGKKGDQLAAQPQAESASEAMQQRTLRGKQRVAKEHEEAAAPHVTPPAHPAAEETKQATATAALSVTQTAAPAAPPQPAPIVLELPLPPMPDAPPPELTQSVFSSSPVP